MSSRTPASSSDVAGPSLRARTTAWFVRRYPFLSGCGTLANHRMTRRIAGELPDEAWAPIAGSIRAHVPLADFNGRAIWMAGAIDRKIHRVVERILRPGDTFVDVGANLGSITFTGAAVVGATGRVIAFEPNPRLAAYLQRSIDEQSLTSVQVERVAVGSEPGELELMVPEGHSGRGSFIRRQGDKATRSVTVPVARIDAWLPERLPPGGRIRLMKIDVEGFEGEVMTGATGILDAGHPDAVIFELNEQVDRFADHAAVRPLADRGYTFHAIRRSMVRMAFRTVAPDEPFGGVEEHDIVAVAPGDEAAAIRSFVQG